MKYFIALLFIFTLTSCNEKVEQVAQTQEEHADHEHHDNEHHDHEHAHAAPNGGILTDIGDHSASLEWLIEEGKFKLFIFDGCAEKPIRVAHENLKINVKDDAEKTLTLLPVTNKLTGEKPGDSNTFMANADNLNKEKISAILVQSIKIQGIDYTNVNLEIQ